MARILDVIDQSGVAYQLTPMGTILEGEWEQVMAVVTACFKTLQSGLPAHRHEPEDGLSRRIRNSRLRSKIAKVEQHLGRKLKTGD